MAMQIHQVIKNSIKVSGGVRSMSLFKTPSIDNGKREFFFYFY